MSVGNDPELGVMRKKTLYSSFCGCIRHIVGGSESIRVPTVFHSVVGGSVIDCLPNHPKGTNFFISEYKRSLPGHRVCTRKSNLQCYIVTYTTSSGNYFSSSSGTVFEVEDFSKDVTLFVNLVHINLRSWTGHLGPSFRSPK